MERKCTMIRYWMQFLYEAVFSSLILCFLESMFIKEEPNLFLFPITFALYMIYYGLREWAPNNILMLLTHFLLVGGIYYLPFALNIRVLFALLQVYLIYASVQYIRNDRKQKMIEDLPWPSFLTCVLIYFFSMLIHDEMLKMLAYICTLVLLVLYYIITYVEGLYSYVESTKDVSGVPLKRMISSNSIVVVAIIGFLLVGLLFGRLAFVEEFARFVGQSIIKGATFLVMGFIWLVFKFIRLFLPEENIFQYPALAEVVRNAETKDHSFLNTLVTILFLLVVLYFCYGLLLRFIEFLLKKRQPQKDVVESTRKQNVEHVRRMRQEKKREREDSLIARARRYYRKRIRAYEHRISLSNQDSCRDIERRIAAQCEEDVGELTNLYSRVRYSDKTITREEVERMK